MEQTAGRRWSRRAALAALTGAVALAGLAAPAHAEDKIVLGALRFTSHAPSFIAYERGYFKDEGLDVELKFFQAAQPIAVAIASGDVDFGVTALTGGFYSLADKGAVKVVGGLYAEKPGVPGMAIMASNQAWEAGLKSPADLKGHSWAMTQQGSSFHYVAGQIAAKYGFDLSDIALKPLQKVPAMIAAVKSGQVDAMAMVPHVAVPLEKAGAARIIGWVRDLGPWQVTTIFTSTGNVEKHRDLVERFLKAYEKGIADYRAAFLDPKADPAKKQAIVEIIHKYVYADKPLEAAAPSIEAGAVYMTEGAALDIADIAKQLAWFQKHGLAPESLTLDKMVDTSFVATTK
ncbi:NitT/TauT family transport system substrate-binding protein [Tistlia consotensis]|uniref:NitT/TauT family transport system substrate-binding protein n=1 Tax=Tistlia consotensis USBA 355 TaxID=560819 RepID=A0A1Y6C6U7_9PROT|nr:ABC transporter substrate-binding protein [Tistlia consotensis]SMF48257.1 NitT/TauT family transport system substrate-binding protein [Tistlia consotensis USBA 355]SNR81505.1 NitT/TauT family transport system substrate-binding protein [Tistlia consotensis]